MQQSQINNDLDALKDCLPTNRPSSLSNKRIVRYKIIRPETAYQATIDKFNAADIHQMVTDGYFQGMKAMNSSFETGIVQLEQNSVNS